MKIIISSVLFFLIGAVFGIGWSYLSFRTGPQKSIKTNSIPFNIPAVPLPANWTTKENSPGNSFDSAFPLNTGIQTQGTLNMNNVIDYYSFTLKDPSQIIVNITNVPKALYWVLYDSQLQQVSASYRTGASQGSTQIGLQNPGKYYIKVWADYNELVNYPYTIRLNILPYFE